MSKAVDVQAAGCYRLDMASARVYLVDDDRLASRGLAEALRTQTGHSVATFFSPEDALAAVAKRSPDVVIAAHRLAGSCDGLTLLERVRALCPYAVGIVMATYGDADSMRAVLDAVGQLRVVNKPCDLIDLELKILAGLELVELRRELEAAQSSAREARGEAATATERLVASEQHAALGRVVSGLAHEVDEQLALIGYAEAIKSRVADDPELVEFADVIITAQRRLAAMVDEMRDFVVAGRDDSARALAREPSDLCAVVDDALSILRYDRVVRERSLARDYRVRPLVSVDRKKLAQVIINLVANAALATQPGDTITVEIDRDDEAGAAVVTVVDHGCGMAEQVLQRLGEPFFSTRGDTASGLGVGICKRIVEDHGGTLVFESRVGVGTRVRATVPLLEEEAA